MTSASRDLSIAQEFAKPGGYIFLIRVSKNNPYHNFSLQGISFLEREKEILLFPNFYFQVIKIYKKEKEKPEIKFSNRRKFTYIEIKEIPNQNILNLEKYQLPKIVWLDPSFQAKSKKKDLKSENQKLLMYLQSQFSQRYIKPFSEIMPLIQHVASQGKKFILITNGTMKLNLVYKLRQYLKGRVPFDLIVYTSEQSRAHHIRELEKEEIDFRHVISSPEELQQEIQQIFKQNLDAL